MIKIKHGLQAFVIAAAFALPAKAEVTVTFSDYLNKKMGQIDRIEKSRESKFREASAEGPNPRVATGAAVLKTRFRDMNWGNAELIPDVDNYNVEALITAMMELGVKEAAPDFEGNINLHIKRINVNNFAAVSIASRNTPTRMQGTVSVYSREGDLIAEQKVMATVNRPNLSSLREFEGRGYAYAAAAKDTRVGPIAAEFTQKALERIFPTYDARGAVLVR
ncbi:hypothetical protein [Kordiimonas laminariae]|uniref:hypothetical protein n=1 Tax=Kordiimonas laminariae TaxID=2917717 RepID=UPI001FF555C5|nr:hypothetical protein [Kordiimonas laminariae]MCK0067912.1 hypothetical protein [Kordiimonas laminariae]